MNIYIFNIFLVLLIFILSPKRSKDKYTTNNVHGRYGRISIIIIFTTMFLEMGLRGDLYIDTINYYNKFVDLGHESLKSVLQGNKDLGYDLISHFFFRFISQQYLYYLLFISVVISACFSIFIYRESLMIWLSFFVLLCSGSFYSGFNIMKEIMVVSFFSLLYYYIYRRCFVKYVLITLFISMIHTSALFMLPVYFLPLIRWKHVDYKWAIALLILTLYLAGQIMGVVVEKLIGTFWVHLAREGAFGMDEGISLQGTIKAVVLGMFVVLNLKKFNKNSSREMLIYNGCIMYVFFAICGYKLYMIQRFVHYFTPCLMIGYPIVISRINDLNRRRIVLALTVIVLILSSINIILEPPYYFYWNNVVVKW